MVERILEAELLFLLLLPPSCVSDVGLLPPSLLASGQLLRRENCGWREEGEEDEEEEEDRRWGDGGKKSKRLFSPRGLRRLRSYQSPDGRRACF